MFVSPREEAKPGINLVQPVKQFVCSASFCQLKNFSQTQLACKPGAEKEEGASATRPGWKPPAENPGASWARRAGPRRGRTDELGIERRDHES